MKNDVLIWILIASVLVFAIGITSIDFANGQSVATTIGTSSTAYNGTQYIPVYLPPQQVQNLQGVAQQSDTNSIVSIASILFTGTIAPFIIKMIRSKSKESEEEHETNVFRLEATSSALKAQNESIQETDKAAYQQAKIIQGMLRAMTKKPEIKAMFNEEKIDGIGLVDYVDRFVAESKNDLEEYYNRNNLPQDDFDTCKDPIVQSVTAVRNKSRK